MLPGALLTGVLVWRAFANNRAASERRLLESARVDASALDREFDSTIRILEALATSPALDAGDFEAFYHEGRRVQATQPGWYTITLVAPDGRQLVSTFLPWGTPLLTVGEPDSLQRLLATRSTGGRHRRAPAARRLGALVPIRVPVVREDTLKYALSAIVNVDSLARVDPASAAELGRVDPHAARFRRHHRGADARGRELRRHAGDGALPRAYPRGARDRLRPDHPRRHSGLRRHQSRQVTAGPPSSSCRGSRSMRRCARR